MSKGFAEYFLGLTPKNNKRNPWFVEYWEHQFSCKVSARLQSNSIETLTDLRSRICSWISVLVHAQSVARLNAHAF